MPETCPRSHKESDITEQFRAQTKTRQKFETLTAEELRESNIEKTDGTNC